MKNSTHKTYSFLIGRFQPLHVGHKVLIHTVLDEGKNVCIGLKDTEINDSNPYTIEERNKMFAEHFWKEIELGTLKVITVPDIDEVCYGRTVGWGIREIRLDKGTEAISATNIRKLWRE